MSSGLGDNHRRRSYSWLLAILLLVTWEFISRFTLGKGLELPLPSSMLKFLVDNYSVVLRHSVNTMGAALIGLIAGNLTAFLLALLFIVSRVAEDILRTILKALFGIPIILIGLLVSTLVDPFIGSVLMALVTVYFPSLETSLLALNTVDSQLLEVARSAGAGKIQLIWKVLLPASRPALLLATAASFPFAVLGAMIGELGGARWGLGTFLQGTMTTGNPSEIWAVGLWAAGIALAGYSFLGLAHQKYHSFGQTPMLATGLSNVFDSHRQKLIPRLLAGCFSIASALILWHCMAIIIHKPFIFWSPLDTFRRLKAIAEATSDSNSFLQTLAWTIGVAILGGLLGLATAWFLSIVGSIAPSILQAANLISMISQSIPMLAMVALIMAVVHDRFAAMLLVSIAATFFPAFVLLNLGLQRLPSGALDLFYLYGASRWESIWKLRLPAALPYLAAGGRLVAARAVAGVVLGEYLLTNQGVGGLLYRARGASDFGVIWCLIFIFGSLAVLTYGTFGLLTKITLEKYGSEGHESTSGGSRL